MRWNWTLRIMPLAYSCPECDRAWPHVRAFSTCPYCRVPCRSATATPLTKRQVEVELLRVKFNRDYAKREATRKGPTPEELGEEEAATLIYLDKQVSRCGKCGVPVKPILCEFREPVCSDCWRDMNGDAA